MTKDDEYSTVSIHRRYLPKLQELKRRHRMPYTAIVETLVDQALDDPKLLVPEVALEPRNDNGSQD